MSLGAIHQHQAHYDVAEEFYKKALKTFTESNNDPLDVGGVLASLSALYHFLGREEESADYQERLRTMLLR
jgi:hypothetical protein